MAYLIVNTGTVDDYVTERATHLDGAGRAWARRHLRRFLMADARCRTALRTEHLHGAAPAALATRDRALRHGLVPAWFEVPADVDEEISRVLDWIGALPSIDRRLAGKRSRIPYAHAAVHSRRWHARLARAGGEAIDDDPGGVEPVLELPDGWRWVRLVTPAALDFEGRRMRHCVGQGTYDHFRTQIFSLRNGAGEPCCTVEFDAGRERIQQAKGRANTDLPAKYMDAFTVLLEHLGPKRLNTRLTEFVVAEDGRILRVSRAAEWPAGTRILHSLVLTNHQDVRTLPEGLHVNGALVLANCPLTTLPAGLTVGGALAGLFLSPVEELPEGLTTRILNLEDSAVKTIAPGTRVLKELKLVHSPVRALPPDLAVGEILVFDGTMLRTLPADLKVAGHCVADMVPGALPETVVAVGDIRCADLPFDTSDSVSVYGRLSVGAWPCPHLPAELTVFGDVDLSDTAIGPEATDSRLVVHGSLDLTGTGLARLPETWTVHGRLDIG